MFLTSPYQTKTIANTCTKVKSRPFMQKVDTKFSILTLIKWIYAPTLQNLIHIFKRSNQTSCLYLKLSQYCLLYAICKLFESIIKRVVDLLNRNNFLSNEQYSFCSSMFTADILNVITHSEMLDNKFIMRSISLDISKATDKVWLEELP